jgi:hypothetical protein
VAAIGNMLQSFQPLDPFLHRTTKLKQTASPKDQNNLFYIKMRIIVNAESIDGVFPSISFCFIRWLVTEFDVPRRIIRNFALNLWSRSCIHQREKEMHLRSGEESDRAWEEKIGDHHTYEGHIYGHVAVDKTFPILTEQT